MRRILVIGASGGIGVETVRLALDRGHAVRALARRADRISLVHPALETVSADAGDAEAVRAALDGVDAVVQTLGVAARPGRMFTPITLFSSSTRVLVSEMSRVGVRRLVAVTGFGAGQSRAAMSPPEQLAHRFVLGTAYDDKDRQEAIIRESDLDWLIVRPTILTNGAGRGRYHVLVAPGTWRAGLIARRDVADFLVRQAGAPTLSHEAPVLAY